MADGSIFSSIMGDMQSFGDALLNTGNVYANKASNASNATETQELRAFRLQNLLSSNKINEPYGPQSFQAGKSQPTQSVNSDTVNQQWLQRLNRYSSMAEYQGGRAKGA